MIKQLGALGRIADGALFFGAFILVFGLVRGLGEEDHSALVTVASNVTTALFAGLLWYAIARFRARRRDRT